MSKAKKVFIILAVVFIIIGLAMTGIAMAAAGFDFKNINTVSYETKIYDIKESFEVLIVDDTNCDIRMLASESDVCKVTVCDTAGMEHQVEAYDGALHVTSNDNRKWYEHIGIFSSEDCEVVIELPEAEYRSALLKTMSGDIDVSDGISFEDAILISTSGDVLFNGVVKNELTARSTSGEVVVENIETTYVNVESTSGDVKLSGISGFSVIAASTSGDVQLSDVNVKGLVTSSTSGDIDMDVVNVENKAEIEAVSGDIEFDAFDAGTIEMKTASGDVKGEIITPKNIITDTSSGDVTVPVSDSTAGDCVIETVSGDIKIELEQ